MTLKWCIQYFHTAFGNACCVRDFLKTWVCVCILFFFYCTLTIYVLVQFMPISAAGVKDQDPFIFKHKYMHSYTKKNIFFYYSKKRTGAGNNFNNYGKKQPFYFFSYSPAVVKWIMRVKKGVNTIGKEEE